MNFIQNNTLYFKTINLTLIKQLKTWIFILITLILFSIVAHILIKYTPTNNNKIISLSLINILFAWSFFLILILNYFLLTPIIISVKKITFISKNLISNKFRIKNILPIFTFLPILFIVFLIQILIIFILLKTLNKDINVFLNVIYNPLFFILCFIYFFIISLISSFFYNWISKSSTLILVCILMLIMPFVLMFLLSYLFLNINDKGDHYWIYDLFFYLMPTYSITELINIFIFSNINYWTKLKELEKVKYIIIPIVWIIILMFFTFIKPIGRKDTKWFFKSLFKKYK